MPPTETQAPKTSPRAYVSEGLKNEALQLRERWKQLQEKKPKLRIRDAAEELDVSEAQLLATGCGETVTRLEGDWPALIAQLSDLGRVMALTRNEHAVHERYGEYRGVESFHGMGQVVGPDIDLRLFYSHWHLGFAVQEQARGNVRRSLQFFDLDGAAIHKVYLTEESNLGAFEKLVEAYTSEDQSPYQAVKSLEADSPELPDSEIDVKGLREAWAKMEDTHQFFGLLKRFGVSRTQALRLVGTEFAQPLAKDAPRRVLDAAAEKSLPIMVFVSNAGLYQIHTGEVHTLKEYGEWYNVLDPDFNLHLRETGVDNAWLVRKPTKDGDVTSVELYAADQSEIALFFGKRKPGMPENETWRALASSLPQA
ncbi:MAG: ChuX/HutX family heme-like substrate-binding protein [Verrucomicrobiota bacterium]